MNIWWWYSYEWMFHFLDNKINTSPDVIPHLIKLDSLLFTPNNTLKFLKFLQSSYFQAPTNTHTHTHLSLHFHLKLEEKSHFLGTGVPFFFLKYLNLWIRFQDCRLSIWNTMYFLIIWFVGLSYEKKLNFFIWNYWNCERDGSIIWTWKVA